LEKLAIKMSLKEMLDLVLKHNIYSPSNDTQSEEQFQAMTVFSQCILKMCMEPVASKNSRTNEVGIAVIKHSLTILLAHTFL